MEFSIKLEDYSEETRAGIIKETKNRKLLNYAVKSAASSDRAAAALNPIISEAQIRLLAKDPSDEVKSSVLRNKKMPGNIIDMMFDDNNVTTYENLIVNHPNVLKKTLKRFLKYRTDKNLCLVAQRRLMYM